MLALYVAMPAVAVDEARDDDAGADHRRVGPLREHGAADLGDRVACAAPLGCGPLLGSHHGPRAVDQFRLDGRAADVDGECEIVIVGHRARMAWWSPEPRRAGETARPEKPEMTS